MSDKERGFSERYLTLGDKIPVVFPCPFSRSRQNAYPVKESPTARSSYTDEERRLIHIYFAHITSLIRGKDLLNPDQPAIPYSQRVVNHFYQIESPNFHTPLIDSLGDIFEAVDTALPEQRYILKAIESVDGLSGFISALIPSSNFLYMALKGILKDYEESAINPDSFIHSSTLPPEPIQVRCLGEPMARAIISQAASAAELIAQNPKIQQEYKHRRVEVSMQDLTSLFAEKMSKYLEAASRSDQESPPSEVNLLPSPSLDMTVS